MWCNMLHGVCCRTSVKGNWAQTFQSFFVMLANKLINIQHTSLLSLVSVA